MASNSVHSHLGQAHSGLPERNSRPPVSAKLANNDRVESPPPDRDSNLQGNSTVVMFATVPVYGYDSGASSTGDRCSVTGLAVAVNVHVSTIPPAQQSHSETEDHPRWRDNSNSPLVAVTTMVRTFDTTGT